jgi:hypothetical protein
MKSSTSPPSCEERPLSTFVIHTVVDASGLAAQESNEAVGEGRRLGHRDFGAKGASGPVESCSARDVALRLDEDQDRLGSHAVELHRVRRSVGLQRPLERV